MRWVDRCVINTQAQTKRIGSEFRHQTSVANLRERRELCWDGLDFVPLSITRCCVSITTNYVNISNNRPKPLKVSRSISFMSWSAFQSCPPVLNITNNIKQLLTMIATILAPCENFSRRFEQIWLHHEDSNVSCKNLAKRSARLQGHCSAVLRFNSAASHRSMRPQTKPNGKCPRAVALVTCLVPLDPFGSLNT